MPSQVTIINLALTRLGQATISSVDEASTEASTAITIYDTVLRAVLQDHAWAFNTRRVLLALRDINTFGTGFSLAYAIPSDCLQVYEIWNGGASADIGAAQRVPFIEENNILYTNKPHALLVYGAYEPVANAYSPLFVDAFAFRLAAELSIPLSQRTSMFDTMMSSYQEVVQNAKFKNATSAVPFVTIPAYIKARS